MNDLVPLLLLWALGNRCPTPSSPGWPSVIDPPPPPPLPRPPSMPDDATSSATEAPEPAKPSWPGFIDYKPPKPAAPKPKTLNQFLRANTWLGKKLDALMDTSVANLQTTLIKRGYKVKKDGIYGPETEAAWQVAATKAKLSPIITKRGTKIARVSKLTWSGLNGLPVIP